MTGREYAALTVLLVEMKGLFVEWRQSVGGSRAQEGVKAVERAQKIMGGVPAEDEKHVILVLEPGVRVRIGGQS